MTDHGEARQRLINALNEEHNPSYLGDDSRDAEQLVNDLAHELAEKIRRGTSDPLCHLSDEYYMRGLMDAADLIDPEVQS